MNLGLFTVSTFDLIPMVNRISTYLSDEVDFDSSILVQCEVANSNDYHPNIKRVSIGKYKNRSEVLKQSILFKLQKYIALIYQAIKFYLTKKHSVVYVIDMATLNIVLLLKWIIPFRDVYIIYHQFELLELGELSRYNKFNFWWFKRLKGKLDLFIAPEINRIDYFIETSGIQKERTIMFPNTTVVNSSTKVKGRASGAKLTIGHIGIAGKDHYVHEFIELLNELDSDVDVQVIFIGYLPDPVKSLIAASSYPNIQLVGDVPHHKLKDYYNEIDVGLILYRDLSLNFKYCAPNKLYEYWSYGIPVIAHKLDGLLPIFKDKDLGVLTDMDNKEEFKNNVLTYLRSITSETRNNVKRLFEKEFTITTHLESLKSRILQNVSG